MIMHDHNCGNMGGGCDCGAACAPELPTRSHIAQLLTGRCNNCYSTLPGPVGCSVHSKGWHWLTPNFGPFCDDCWKEVTGVQNHDKYLAVDGVVSQRAERMHQAPGFATRFFEERLAMLRREAPEGDLNFRLWVYR